jgi:hypothetical protein
MALQMCTSGNAKLTEPSFHSTAALKGHDIVRLMSKVQFPINETVLAAKVWENLVEGTAVTSRVMTSEGFCMTFNMADHKDIFRQDTGLSEDFESYANGRESEYDLYKGYRHNNKTAYPVRILAGGKNAVTFIMAQNKHDIDEGES